MSETPRKSETPEAGKLPESISKPLDALITSVSFNNPENPITNDDDLDRIAEAISLLKNMCEPNKLALVQFDIIRKRVQLPPGLLGEYDDVGADADVVEQVRDMLGEEDSLDLSVKKTLESLPDMEDED